MCFKWSNKPFEKANGLGCNGRKEHIRTGGRYKTPSNISRPSEQSNDIFFENNHKILILIHCDPLHTKNCQTNLHMSYFCFEHKQKWIRYFMYCKIRIVRDKKINNTPGAKNKEYIIRILNDLWGKHPVKPNLKCSFCIWKEHFCLINNMFLTFCEPKGFVWLSQGCEHRFSPFVNRAIVIDLEYVCV